MSIAKEIRMRSWNVWGGLVIAGALALPVAWAQTEGKKSNATASESKQVEKPIRKAPATKPAAMKPAATKPGKPANGDPGAVSEEVKVLVPVEKIKSITDEQMANLRAIADQAEKDKELIMDKAREA